MPSPSIQIAQSTTFSAWIAIGRPARIEGSSAASAAELPSTTVGSSHEFTYAHGYSVLLPPATSSWCFTISRARNGRAPDMKRSRTAGSPVRARAIAARIAT